ncbi:MAG: DUF2490 domain-containing protein [Panacibacter sp.]
MKKSSFSKLILVPFFISTSVFSLSAQTTGKKITTRPVAWYSYFNTLQLSSRLSVTSDVSERYFFDNGKQYQFFLRTMGNWNFAQNWTAGAGFAYIRSHTFDPASVSKLAVPELRPFQELIYKQKFNKITLSHRYRIEERFIHKTANDKLANGSNFNFRFRYQLTFDYNLYKSKDNTKSLNLKAGDEIMFNAGKNIVSNIFDQNRIYVGLNYQPINNIAFQLDYMNAFQERSSGTQFNQGNIIRLSIFQKIKLYK